MLITIDGPSGTGKSTIAKSIAKKLSIAYFDTGAMYRSIAWFFLEEKIDFERESELEKALRKLHLSVNEQGECLVNSVNVSKKIRSEKISMLSSEISRFPAVRLKLLSIQRNLAKKQSGVFEGRDMGSKVFPKAEAKFYLTADVSIRAKRRLDQLKKQFPEKDFAVEEIEKSLEKRDLADQTRRLSPLKKTEDMHEIDTTHLSIDEVILEILKNVPKKKMGFFYRMAFVICRKIFRCCYRFHVTGEKELFRGPALVIANHTSYYDPPLAVLALEEELHFLARKGLFAFAPFRWLIVKLHAHPLRQGKKNIQAVKTTLQLLEEGNKVLLFPEGGRSMGEQIEPLEMGIGLLARESKVPIIPLYISGAADVWNKTRSFPKCFGKIGCHIGAPILPEEFAHLEKKEFIKKIVQESSHRLCLLEKEAQKKEKN